MDENIQQVSQCVLDDYTMSEILPDSGVDLAADLPDFIVPKNYFLHDLAYLLRGFHPSLSDLQDLQNMLQKAGLSDYIRLQKLGKYGSSNADTIVARFSVRAASGARQVGISDVSMLVQEQQDVAQYNADIRGIYEHLSKIIFNAEEKRNFSLLDALMNDSEYFDKLRDNCHFWANKREKLSRDADLFYRNFSHNEEKKSADKLIFTEKKNEKVAASLLLDMLPYFKERKMPIFLGSLIWESFEPLLQQYYEFEVASENFLRVERLLAGFLKGIKREEDLLALIKEARLNDVRIYAVGSIISASGMDGDKLAYAAMKIIDHVSPARYALLYNNELIGKELDYLPKILNGLLISCFEKRSSLFVSDGFSVSSDTAKKELVEGLITQFLSNGGRRRSSSARSEGRQSLDGIEFTEPRVRRTSFSDEHQVDTQRVRLGISSCFGESGNCSVMWKKVSGYLHREAVLLPNSDEQESGYKSVYHEVLSFYQKSSLDVCKKNQIIVHIVTDLAKFDDNINYSNPQLNLPSPLFCSLQLGIEAESISLALLRQGADLFQHDFSGQRAVDYFWQNLADKLTIDSLLRKEVLQQIAEKDNEQASSREQLAQTNDETSKRPDTHQLLVSRSANSGQDIDRPG